MGANASSSLPLAPPCLPPQLFRAGEDVFTAPPPPPEGAGEGSLGVGEDRMKTRLVSQYHKQKSIAEEGAGEEGETTPTTPTR